MKDGFIRIATATPLIEVADCLGNADKVIDFMREAENESVTVLVLPELVLTGYTCSDLFLSQTLLTGALSGLKKILAASVGLEVLTLVGLPLAVGPDLFNVAAAVQDGKLLGLVPKMNIPNYSEFYEARHFSAGQTTATPIRLLGQDVLLGSSLLFACREVPDLVVGVEICEDLWVIEPPSLGLAHAGATVIANLSASDELIGKAEYRRLLVKSQSGRLLCAYAYADAGEGESSTDLVFSGHNLICENGRTLAESPLFSTGLLMADVDVASLNAERRRQTTFPGRKAASANTCQTVFFSHQPQTLDLKRAIAPHPFVPSSQTDLAERCEEILTIQVQG